MKLNQEHIIGISCIAVSAVILSITPTFPKGQEAVNITGPAFFPNLLALIFIACGVYQVWYGSANRDRFAAIGGAMVKEMASHSQTRTAYVVIGLMVGFILFFDILGFIVTTLAFLIVFMKRLGVPPLKNLLYSSIFTVTIYFLFGWLFTISLPSGILSYIGL